ncbi:MAG: dynamin family protein [Lachnospiraceae bacterium]|nr:dynamin family protein [Lachnospiraceae bacterium]
MEIMNIVSNPYEKKIEFKTLETSSQEWRDIRETNPNSKLREVESENFFLPFKIKEIMDTIADEYCIGKDKISVMFSGTLEEYRQVEEVCKKDGLKNKIQLSRASIMLENARHILEDAKKVFLKVKPTIEDIIKDDEEIKKDLYKVSDALDDIIPICVFGNYSSGKSTFINALIGEEILPSGGDPITSKIYEIHRESSADEARITFTFKEIDYLITFEENTYRLEKGDKNCKIMSQVKECIDEVSSEGMFAKINAALKVLNGFDKKDAEEMMVGEVIKISVPFSKDGVLGQSLNKFVIFDTPGSNSKSNANHSVVLKQAMENFSNGIPVWISVYESIDSEDNAELCDEILSIKALDNRFTMIVSNKADGSDLDEEKFTDEKIKEILNYSAIKKMYTGGIYFVSSIMGLGSKKKGNFTDKHYRKIYRSQKEMYEDPEDEDYISLYEYNIMPAQVKEEVVGYSENSTNIIYANSGLLCIEMEMEKFASRYSAYNKCQMVYDFLSGIIDETDKRLQEKIVRREKMKSSLEEDFNKVEQELILEINEDVRNTKSLLEKDSKEKIESYAKEHAMSKRGADEFAEKDSSIRQENEEKSLMGIHDSVLKDAKEDMIANFISNGKNLFNKDFVKNIKKLGTELKENYEEMAELDDSRNEEFKKINVISTDAMIKYVIDEYKKDIENANELIDQKTQRYWSAEAEKEKEHLIDLITESENLSIVKRKEITEIIMDYEPLTFKDNADSLFIKQRFLRGNLLGFKFIKTEELNIRKITTYYNKTLEKNVLEMAGVINKKSKDNFNIWLSNLMSVIELNITEYNPELKELKESIKEETEIINKLVNNKQDIKDSFETITSMMKWKSVE